MNKRFKLVVSAFCALLGSAVFAEEIKSSDITSDIENDYGENPYGSVCRMSAFLQKTATLKWCSLGTSITWYNDEPRPEVGLTHGYQDRTIEKLGLNKAANFINRGVSGARIGDANTEPPTGSPCDIFTLEWGINDWMRGTRVGNLEIFRRRLANPNDACEDITTEVWYTFAARYAGVITQIKAINPDAIIILMTPRKAFNNNNNLNNSMPAHWWDQSTPDSAQQEATYLYDYVKLIRAIGEEINCPVVDQFRYAANVENLESLSIDKALHPNDAGYEVMANLLAPVMSKAIEAKYGITRCTHGGTTSVVPGTAATCTEAGTTDQTVCTNPDCQMVLVPSETIPALGHDWGAWTVTTPATESATGMKERTCQRTGCNEKETLTIPRVGEVVALRNIAVVTKVGELPVLPAQVAGLRADGTVAGLCDVVWAEHSAPSAVGKTTIAGTAMVDGVGKSVTASVRATVEQSDDDIQNLVFGNPPTTAYPMSGISYPYASLNATAYANQVNGLYENNSFVWGGALGAAKDGDYNGKYAKEVFVFEFTLAKTSTVKGFTVWHMTDSGWLLDPYPAFVEVSADNGTTWTSVAVTGGARPKSITSVPTANGSASVFKYDYELASPAPSVTKLRLKFSPYGIETPEPGDSSNWKGLKISEIEVFGIEGESGGPLEPLTTDTLTALEVDNAPVEGFSPTTLSYSIDEALAITSATSSDNMGITILPRANGAARVVTLSESGSTKTYTVEMPAACEHANTTVTPAVSATCTTDGHTRSVYCEDCKRYLEEAQTIQALGHDWGAWTVTKEPSKTEAGYREHTCQRVDCGVTEGEDIPKLTDVVALRNVAVVTAVGTAPTLPAKVAGLKPDGTLGDEYDVVWASSSAPTVAGVTTVNGTATVNGSAMPVTASVRAEVVSSGSGDLVNIAPLASSLTVDVTQDDLKQIDSTPVVLTNNYGGAAMTIGAWNSPPSYYRAIWYHGAAGQRITARFAWTKTQRISKVFLAIYDGNQHGTITLQNGATGETIAFTRKANADDYYKINQGEGVQCLLAEPVSLTELVVDLEAKTGAGWIGYHQIEIFAEGGGSGGSVDPLSSDTLTELSVDGTPVAGFVPTTYAYTVENGEAITSATSTDNMGITILPKYNGAARVVTFAEDAESTKTYSVAMPTVTVCLHEHTTTNGAVAATCTTAGSTGTVTCDECHETVREPTVIPALGHDWGEWEVTKDATRTETGSRKRVCRRAGCGEEQTETIPMIADIVALRNVAVATAVGVAPTLPAKVAGLMADGTTNGEYAVSWPTAAAPSAAGVTTVTGTAQVNGAAMTVTASVRAAIAGGGDLVNIAPLASSMTVTPIPTKNPEAQNQSDITNGWAGSSMVIGQWCTPKHNAHRYFWTASDQGTIKVDFAWPTAQKISKVGISVYDGNQHGTAALKYGSSGETISSALYDYVKNGNSYYKINQGDAHLYTFKAPIELSELTVEVTKLATGTWIGIYQIEIFAEADNPEGPSIEPLSAASLSALAVDGTPVAGFAPTTLNYSVEGGSAISAAISTDNMGITILPKFDGTAYVVTLAEDGKATKTYSVAMPAAALKATVKVVDRTGKETTITKPLDEIVGAINGAVASAGYGSKVLLPALDMDYAVTLAPGVRVVKNADSTGTVTLVVPDAKRGWYELNAAGDAMVLSAGAVPVFAAMAVGDDSAVLTLGNVKAGLYYAIIRSETLFGFETAPVVATAAPVANGTADFPIALDEDAASAFYKALVTDDPAKADDPRGGGEGDDDPVTLDITEYTWCSLGTSITDFNDDPTPGRSQGYQFFLMDDLDWDHAKLTNSGHSGTLISSSSSTPPATPCDIYTIEFGVNDWARGHDVGTLADYKNPYYNGNAVRWDNFAACYRVLIDKIKAVNPNAVIVLITPRKAYGSSSDSGTRTFPANCDDPTLPGSIDSYYNPEKGMVQGKQTYLKDYADLIKAIGEYEGFPVVDWYSSAATQDNLASLSVDVAVHPNDAGYRIMAGLLKPVLLKAVQDKFGGGEGDDDDDGDDPVRPAEYGPWNIQVLDPTHVVVQFDGSYGVEKNYVESGVFSTDPLTTEYNAIKSASFTVNGTATAQAGHAIAARGQMSYTNAYGQTEIVGGTNNQAWELRAVHNFYLTLASALVDGTNTVVLPDARTLPFVYGANTVSPLFKVNQVGYAASAAEKYVYLGGWMGTAGSFPLADSYSYEIHDVSSGAVALTGTFTKRMNDTDHNGVVQTGEKTLEADISALTAPGTYYVRVEGIGRSMDFRVDDSAAADQFAVHMLGLYQQRCGCAKEEPYTHWTDDACHMKVYRGVHPSNDDEYQKCFGGTAQNAFSIIQANASSCTEELSLPGGWHDAADYDRRPYHLKVVIDLANTYLMRPQNFTDGQLAIPENANGIPDILDEADWGLRHLLSAQQADGGVGAWIETITHPDYGNQKMPSHDTDIFNYYLGRATHRSTLKYCGAAANLARALYTANTPASNARADVYKASAVAAWNYVMNTARQTNVAMKGPNNATVYYSEPTWYDPYEYAKAAINLGVITGDSSYFNHLSDQITYRGGGADNYNYGDTGPYAVSGFFSVDWSCISRDESFGRNGFILSELGLPCAADSVAAYQTIKTGWVNRVKANANEILASMTTAMPYRNASLGLNKMAWGQCLALRNAEWLCAAHFFTGDAKYLKAAQLASDFQSGCNPCGATWTSGLGTVYPVAYLSLHSFADPIAEYVPGITPYHNTGSDFGYLFNNVTKNRYTTFQSETAAKPWWRRFEVGENMSIGISEYTVTETIGPCAAAAGYLINAGHTTANLSWPKPVAKLSDLPGYWALP